MKFSASLLFRLRVLFRLFPEAFKSRHVTLKLSSIDLLNAFGDLKLQEACEEGACGFAKLLLLLFPFVPDFNVRHEFSYAER